ncbi:hypothetical protein VCV18_011593 [Metarhizium anisopliae]
MEHQPVPGAAHGLPCRHGMDMKLPLDQAQSTDDQPHARWIGAGAHRGVADTGPKTTRSRVPVESWTFREEER